MPTPSTTFTCPPPPARLRRLLLHVGMPRTGSTFIQNACELNRGPLLAQGILYPRSGHVREDGPRAHRTAGHNAWWLGVLRRDPAPLQAVWDEFEATPGAHTLLLSSEELFFVMSEWEFGRIAGALPADRTTATVLLRRQDRWFESMYAEAVTGGYFKVTDGFEQFLAAGEQSASGVPAAWADGNLDYGLWLDRLASYFGPGNVRAASFDNAPKGPAFFTAFARLCGIPAEGLAAPDMQASNSSYGSREAVEVVRFFNRLPFEDGPHYMRFVAAFQDHCRAAAATAPPVFMEPAARRRLLQRYAQSNERVARVYAGMPGGSLFDDGGMEAAPSPSLISPATLHAAHALYAATRGGAAHA